MVNSENTTGREDAESEPFKNFLLLFIIGFLIIFAGIIILVVGAALYGDSTNFGAVIFLWFIPIAVGVGPESAVMILIAIILAVLNIIVFLITRRRLKKASI